MLPIPIHSTAGKIPESFGNLVNLIELDLYKNKLTGALRSGHNSTTTQCLLMLLCYIAGKIPDSFGNLVNLERLKLFENELIGVEKGPY